MSSTPDPTTTPPGREQEPAPAKKIDLSLTQVLGGALAAMTAAFLGSRLSVAGTVIGAALASIVAAVASNLYTASLRTTRDKVRTVWQGRVPDSGMPVTVTTDADPHAPAGPGAAEVDAADAPPTDQPTLVTPTPAAPRRGTRWKSVLLGALAAFVLAFAVLTGIELATGQSLSGGNGTTISQVSERDQQPTKAPTAASSDSATPTPTPSSTPSEQPSASQSATPTPVPAPTASSTAPSPTPSASTSATPTTPTDSATPESGDDAPGSADEGGSDQGGSGTGG